MKNILSARIKNNSSKECFCFALQCEVCKKDWFSRPVSFSKANIKPETAGKKIIYEIIYQDEMDQARKTAIQSGLHEFSVCPICKRLVCDNCFMVCEDLDMCKDCAKELEEKGIAVVAEESY